MILVVAEHEGGAPVRLSNEGLTLGRALEGRRELADGDAG